MLRYIPPLLIALLVCLTLDVWETLAYGFVVAPFAFFFGGCACCESCEIFSDDFTTDRLAGEYTTSGTVAVSAGALTMTTAGAYAIENTAGTTGHGRATVAVKQTTSGGSGRLIGSYVDNDNYLFCELTVNGGSSTFKLWKKVATVDTQLGSTFTFTASTGTYYTLELCWSGDYAVGSLLSAGTRVTSFHQAYSGTGNKAGLGASPNGGTATFDDFVFHKHHIDNADCAVCHGPTCANACVDSLAGGFEVDVTGVTTGTHCTLGVASCAGANALYVFTGPLSTSGGNCNKVISIPEFCGQPAGSFANVGVNNNVLGGTGKPCVQFNFNFKNEFGFSTSVAFHEFDEVFDCNAVENLTLEDVTDYDDGGAGTEYACISAAATIIANSI